MKTRMLCNIDAYYINHAIIYKKKCIPIWTKFTHLVLKWRMNKFSK